MSEFTSVNERGRVTPSPDHYLALSLFTLPLFPPITLYPEETRSSCYLGEGNRHKLKGIVMTVKQPLPHPLLDRFREGLLVSQGVKDKIRHLGKLDAPDEVM